MTEEVVTKEVVTEKLVTETLEHWRLASPFLPDITGWRALDIGCGDGLGTLKLAKHGAWVRGVDTDADALALARAAAVRLGLDGQTEFEPKRIYDLASTWETYDLVLCLGILDGLRYPLLGLDIAVRKARRLLILETQTLSEETLAGAGLCVLAAPGGGLYLCEPDSAEEGNHEEYKAAVALTPRLARTLQFQHCWVNCVPGYTETCYHDGTKVTATPEDSEQYRANTARFGYGTDTGGLSREHEILHTFLAEKLGFGSSPTLWAVAHGQTGNVAAIWEQEEEETWTLAFQTYLHGGPPTDGLQRLSAAGLDPAALREEALNLLR